MNRQRLSNKRSAAYQERLRQKMMVEACRTEDAIRHMENEMSSMQSIVNETTTVHRLYREVYRARQKALLMQLTVLDDIVYHTRIRSFEALLQSKSLSAAARVARRIVASVNQSSPRSA